MAAFNLKTLPALIAAAAVLAAPGLALTNGGDIHFGAVPTGIPVVAIYVVGGFLGAVVLFFLANWARYRRLQKRGSPSQGSQGSGMEEEKEDATGREEK